MLVLLGNHRLHGNFQVSVLSTSPASLPSAPGEVVVSPGGGIQCEVRDILWERRSLWGPHKPTGKPFPTKPFLSHELLSTKLMNPLCSGGCKSVLLKQCQWDNTAG